MSDQQILLALAGNSALRPEHVDELIAVNDLAVLRELASEQRLTPAQVELLAAGGHRDVVEALIRSGRLAVEQVRSDVPWMLLAGIDRPDAPDDWLQVLASWPDPTVRRALGDHVLERLDIAAVLADDPICSVAACATRPWELPEELALRLAARPEACIRVALASSLHAPARILADLIEHGGSPPMSPCPHWPDGSAAAEELCRVVAGNPTTPVDAVAPYMITLNPQIASALAGRPDLAEEAYGRLLALQNDEVTGRVATNWAAPPGLLRRLYDTDAGRWRGHVLANPSIPLDLLVRHSCSGGTPSTDNHPDLDGLLSLAVDADPRVRLVAAASHRLPSEVRAMLIDDPDFAVARRAVMHVSVPPERIRATAARQGPPIFPALAAHPSCPPDVLLAIATHPQAPAEAVTDVAWQEASPPTALAACLRNPANAVYVACNPMAPADMLTELASHPDPDVVVEVARNPALPPQAFQRILTGIRHQLAKVPAPRAKPSR
ncbi:MAG: hypothetical protein HOV77_14710 [Hamadaea sp.]|uniref:hypothetical protein n=1 Tax=Hamadaea sp. TaxID=2024425 RepID=UPI00183DF107|nr:hypothetical protein [Hamadaea sp.]NUT20434.1 hypothetical protein [Hamadaea sp.]